MAGPYYVRSTDGNNADSGLTWALAKATLAGAAAVAGAGETVYVSQVHAESTAASVSLTWTSTLAAPVRIVCGNDGAQPPTALATTGKMTVTGSSNITIAGNIYCYGITFTCGDNNTGGGSILLCNTSSTWQKYEQCSFVVPNTLAASGIQPTSRSPAISSLRCEWLNCSVKFASASHGLKSLQAEFLWNGGSVVSGGTTPTTLVSSFLDSVKLVIENVDFSNFGTGINWVQNTVSGVFIMRNNKFPTSWAGALLTGSLTQANSRCEMYNCDTSLTTYRIWIEDYAGSIRDETTIIKTGGITDEAANQFSLKMVTNANASYPMTALSTMEFAIPHTTSGSSTVFTGNLIRDNATNLTNAECWLTVNEPGSSSSPVNTFNTSEVDLVTAASNLGASSATWTGTGGMTNPNPQDVAVTFTPNAKGSLNARVWLAKASTTIYVDPKPVLT